MKRPLLAGAAGLYRLGLWGVESLYRSKLLKTHTLDASVVSVGNLTWGGTGKTPLVMQLAKGLQKKGRSVAVLTRGYGADEAQLLTERLSPIPVLVGPDRVALGRKAVREFGADLLVLDDGYQQWRLKKDLEILTVDATAPFGNGHLIPRGTLREPVTAAARAHLIVATRADLNPRGLEEVARRLHGINPVAAIFFAGYRPLSLVRWPSGEVLPLKHLKGKEICALAGIAHPEQFEETVASLGVRVALAIRVADHHPYTVSEMIRILTRCQRHGIRHVVTTAKDAVRIPKSLIDVVGPALKGIELLVLEVTLEFNPDESEFLHRVDSLLAG